jgi:hypothetical protein
MIRILNGAKATNVIINFQYNQLQRQNIGGGFAAIVKGICLLPRAIICQFQCDNVDKRGREIKLGAHLPMNERNERWEGRDENESHDPLP